MKTLFTIIIISSLIACNQNGTQKNGLNIRSALTDTVISDNKQIMGLWTMESTANNGLMTSYNATPKVVFDVYGTGSIKFPGREEIFSWTFKKGVLTILNMTQHSNNTFSDTTYYASFSKAEQHVELQISSRDGEAVYYLSK